jgi:CxxC motif-containing protein
MKVNLEEEEIKAVQGNQCKKGLKYAEREAIFPGRILTTTVKTEAVRMPLLPVRSNKEIPKDDLIDCMKEIAKCRIQGPVRVGETLISNILGLGVDIVSSRTLSEPKISVSTG